MRTSLEIVEYYQRVGGDDWLGFVKEVLFPFLSVEELEVLGIPLALIDSWRTVPIEEDIILAQMRNYMEFAWGKARNHRGLSANRSIIKMETWLWLLGRDDIVDQVNCVPYANYGAPQLKVICEALDFPIPGDDGLRNMMESKPCCPDCEEGCCE